MAGEALRPGIEQLSFHIRKNSVDHQRKFVANFQENILLGNPRNHAEGYEDFVAKMTADGDGLYYPILLNTHTAHPAGFTSIEEAAYIRSIANNVLPAEKHITGATLLIASTMHAGQSEDIVKGLQHAMPIFHRFDTVPHPVRRRKDLTSLEGRERTQHIMEYMRAIGNYVDNNKMLIVLPEASVESGRQKPGGVPGEIKGMVEIEPDVITFLAKAVRRRGKEPLLYFMGTTGANKIYDPITASTTNEAKFKAVTGSIPLIKDFIDPLMSAVVDYPTSYREIEKAFGENGNLQNGIAEWYVGERLAQLIPFHERGVYQYPEILDEAPQIKRRNTNPLFFNNQ